MLGLYYERLSDKPIVGVISSYYLVICSSCIHQIHKTFIKKKKKRPCLNLKISIKPNNLSVYNNCLCSFSWHQLPYLTLCPELYANKAGVAKIKCFGIIEQ